MTTTVVPDAAVRPRRRGAPLAAVAGVLALVAFAAAAVVFNDPLRGASTPDEAAAALEGSSITLAATLLGAYALLAIAVTGRLAVRLARGGESASTRLLPLLGAGHVLLLTAAFAAPAAALAVGSQVFTGGVSATGAETALVLMNLAHPMAAWVGAGFLIAVAVAARDSRPLAVVSGVFALGLLLPPVGWAVTYLMPFWFAGVGIWLWRRG
ncbi:UNVERIFIED_ORG: hypothetical protein E4P37_00250 [Bacillus sp. AZ43]